MSFESQEHGEPVITKVDNSQKSKEQLNERQLEAATDIYGPMLVASGAGTGKTKVISHRIANILKSGINPENILLLTFSRAAAQEMSKRIEELVDKKYDVHKIQMSTYHSFCNKELRNNAVLLNIKPNFDIIDTTDSQDIIDYIFIENCNPLFKFHLPNKKQFQNIFSKSRNNQTTIENIVKKHYKDFENYIGDIIRIFDLYTEYKIEHNKYDLDDLLVFFYQHLLNNLIFREKMQEKYKFVLADEFQDSNFVQSQIIELISHSHGNLMVVGDAAQSIYGFRGALPENILSFPNKYPNCRVVKLIENYRSTNQILNIANAITKQFTKGFNLNLFSSIASNEKPEITLLPTDKDEAKFILNKIMEIKEIEGNNFNFGDIAILFRDSYNSNMLQLCLSKAHIKYTLKGGLKFNERKHVKDIVSCIRVVYDRYDIVSWNRVLKLIPNIGNITASKIYTSITENNSFDPQQYVDKKYYDFLVMLNDALLKFHDNNLSFQSAMNALYEFYKRILNVSEKEDASRRKQDLRALVFLSESYTNAHDFLADFALNPPNSSSNILDLDRDESKKIVLSTIHSVKGLEYKYVFIIHMIDGRFPSYHAMNNAESYEEEKRLFYVAATRAKQRLYMTIPLRLHTSMNYSKQHTPADFLKKLPRELYILKDKNSGYKIR